jgi:TDG/mug DNA glycosylase family protein
LTPEELAPSEFERLLGFGIGLTDICKARHGSDLEVGTQEIDIDGLEERISAVEPDSLACNGKSAAKGLLGRSVDYGLQEERVGSAAIWVLPSTSGAARGYWSIGPWKDLADAAGA